LHVSHCLLRRPAAGILIAPQLPWRTTLIRIELLFLTQGDHQSRHLQAGDMAPEMNEFERKKFFKMMQQVHADKLLRFRVLADVRKLAADPVWCAKRAVELRRQAKSSYVYQQVSGEPV
jgi:hypothetical protein